MNLGKALSIALVICGLGAVAVGCSSPSPQTAPSNLDVLWHDAGLASPDPTPTPIVEYASDRVVSESVTIARTTVFRPDKTRPGLFRKVTQYEAMDWDERASGYTQGDYPCLKEGKETFCLFNKHGFGSTPAAAVSQYLHLSHLLDSK